MLTSKGIPMLIGMLPGEIQAAIGEGQRPS